MTPWDFPWPRILRVLRENYGITRAEVLKMTDYELEMWLRPSEQLGRGVVRLEGEKAHLADGKWQERHDRS